ncbi:DUF4149 domain-containing protein [Diaphorobacter aerolatus]|uniref:DUF4149 domain-containing protein n=1 Tax=Diaphorobacter aerolatus TaxID=1288495 RepID=A0A7H0GLQ4_9BURK|nr:DUF4149 domain-containing protein [Diaphorobacter aerolatus]QNP49220.1 DUF4149 domain-containing protein [Diaphorobacter aerolatus]
MYERLPVFAAALWWGSLTAIGFLAVPMLFMHLGNPTMAGNMAAKLFAAQTWVTIACAVALLLLAKRRHAEIEEPWAQSGLVLVIAGLLLALLVQYGVSPRIVARQQIKLWHSVGTVMYALQWFCAAALLWKLSARRLSSKG